MKKILILISLCAIFAACNQQNPNEVIITGKIEGLADNTIINLFEEYSDTPFMIDTAFNETFKFIFQDTAINKLRPMTIIVENGRTVRASSTFWVQSYSKIKINGNEKLFIYWDIESNVPEQQEANRYTNENKSLLIRLNEVLQAMDQTFSLIMEANDDILTKQYNHKIDSLSKIIHSIKYSSFEKELDLLEKEPTHSDFWFSILLEHARSVYDQENGQYHNTHRLISIYNNLSEEQKNNEKAKEAAKYLFPPTIEKVKEGDKMADADLHDLDGKVVHIADYTGKYR